MRVLNLPALPCAALAAALLLGGCQGQISRGIESANQPVVSRTDYVLDVASGGYDGLRSGETGRLGQWFDSLHLGYGDRVSIDDPGHYGGGASRDAIASLVAQHGLLLAETAPVTEGTIPADSVRVVVSRSRAEVPDCPNWGKRVDQAFTAATSPGYGCASNGNLAAMVANPQDLVRGVETDAGTDPRSSTRALKAYRDAPASGAGNALRSESTTKGGS